MSVGAIALCRRYQNDRVRGVIAQCYDGRRPALPIRRLAGGGLSAYRGGRNGMAAAGGRRARAGLRDGGGQEPLEFHEVRAARLGRRRTPDDGVHSVPEPRCVRRAYGLYGGGHVRRVQ